MQVVKNCDLIHTREVQSKSRPSIPMNIIINPEEMEKKQSNPR